VEQGYTGKQVCSIVGITYRQLDYWARTDLVTPSIAEARGSGTQRRYSYTDLLELKVIKSLIDAGVELRKARKALDYVRRHLGGDVASARIVITGGDSLIAETDDALIDLVRQGQGVLNILPMASVKDDLDAKVAELVPLERAAAPDDGDGRAAAAR
jgi:DNA-binding transcriptional MerR regulator